MVETLGQNFGGSVRYLFFVVPLDDPSKAEPTLRCRFVHFGKEVFSIDYKDLSDELVYRGQHGPDNTNRFLHKTIVIDP